MSKPLVRTFETLLCGQEVWQRAVKALGESALLPLAIREKPNPTPPTLAEPDMWLEAFGRFGDTAEPTALPAAPNVESISEDPMTVDFWVASASNPANPDGIRSLKVTSERYDGTIRIISDEARAELTALALRDGQTAASILQQDA
jgi:hypothetical protein